MTDDATKPVQAPAAALPAQPGPPAGAGADPALVTVATGPVPAAAGVLARIKQATGKIFGDYFGPGAGPGPGGAPKSTQPGLAPGQAGPAGPGAVAVVPDDPNEYLRVVKKVWKTVAKSLTGWLDKSFERKLTLLGGQAFAREQVAANALTEPEGDACGEIAAEIGRMFGADKQMMVLAAAVVTVGSVAGRYYLFSQDLNRQLKLQAQLKQGMSP